MKPYPEYFKYITGYFNCQPEECLMIGDSLVNDIGGAGNSGIDSCYYNPGYLKKRLKSSLYMRFMTLSNCLTLYKNIAIII